MRPTSPCLGTSNRAGARPRSTACSPPAWGPRRSMRWRTPIRGRRSASAWRDLPRLARGGRRRPAPARPRALQTGRGPLRAPRLETVRKVSDVPPTRPYGAPKWYPSTDFNLPTPPNRRCELRCDGTRPLWPGEDGRVWGGLPNAAPSARQFAPSAPPSCPGGRPSCRGGRPPFACTPLPLPGDPLRADPHRAFPRRDRRVVPLHGRHRRVPRSPAFRLYPRLLPPSVDRLRLCPVMYPGSAPA